MIEANFKSKGKVYLVRCPKCDRENWLMAVRHGVCCWCGYDANKDEKFKESLEEDKDE